MLAKCACQHCKGHIEFDAGYAGLPIVCPHCGSETELFVPETPLPPPAIKAEGILADAGAGCDVLPGKWMEEPMTEKQKAMFVLYGMETVEGLTKGKASELINSAKQSGVLPSEENKIKAGKLFEAIDRKEKKERLRLISEEISEAIHISQKRRVSIEELERVKQHLAELFEELTEHIDNRIIEVDDAECERQNREDEKRELGELD